MSFAADSSIVAVDIGNSGLRAVRLNCDERLEDGLPRIVRIYWDPGKSEKGRSGDSSRENPDSRSRFDPNSTEWLELLEPIVAQDNGQWLISSVRRDACRRLTDFLSSRGCSSQLVTWRDMPFKVDVQQPERVGIDRLLAGLAASSMLREQLVHEQSDATISGHDLSAHRHSIVIQAGSAVTVDIMLQQPSEDRFLGGAILPGVPMMLKLLGRMADQLPELDANDLTELPPLPGKNTEQAMVLGAASALVGGVQHLVDRYRKELGVSYAKLPAETGNANSGSAKSDASRRSSVKASSVPVILSGGDGTRLAPHLPEPLIVESDLVLRGLWVLAKQRSS